VPKDKETSTSRLRFRLFLKSDALAAISWRYPGQYSAYDLDPGDPLVLEALLRPENNYHAILVNDEMIGYFCLGADARVPGWEYDDHALDLGMGIRPDLTGSGNGSTCFAAVLAHVVQQRPATLLRATIASWNQRAIRMCEHAGFLAVASFRTTRVNGEFVVMVKTATGGSVW
jgi:[ribosomal protein S18]-alanine N-acetyltransferase